MPNQPIKLPNVEYEMLAKLAKSNTHKQIEQYIINLIQGRYNSK